MANAWKHLYLWKSRARRTSAAPPASAADPEAAEDSSSRDSNNRRPLHHHCHGHGSRFHNRQDPNPNPNPNLRRSRSAQIRATRNLCLRAWQLDHTGRKIGTSHKINSLYQLEYPHLPSSPHPAEHDLAWLDRRRNIDLENGVGSVGLGSRAWLIRNNQLPDIVLQARERLLERLGSVSFTGTRESTTASGISGDESAVSHDSRSREFIDREDETSRDQFNSSIQHVHNASKKFSGVNWEALSTLFLEVFRNPEEIIEIIAPQECPICLESFCEGNGLIRLHCGHRFHPMCLQPWVRTCSDCPYCRAYITC